MGQQKPPGGEELLSKVLKEEEEASHSLLRGRNHKNFIKRKRMAGVEVKMVGRGELVIQGLGLGGATLLFRVSGNKLSNYKALPLFLPTEPQSPGVHY